MPVVVERKVVKPESIPLSKKDKRRNALITWYNKPIKTKKAGRLPLAKMMNPEKYIK